MSKVGEDMKRKIKLWQLLFLFFLILCLTVPLFQSLNTMIGRYGRQELEYFTRLIINHASFNIQEENQFLVQIQESEDGKTKSVDYDLLKANDIASSMALNIEETFLAIQNSNYQKKENNEYENRLYEVSQRGGLVTYISLAEVFHLPLLAPILPSIPIYYKMDQVVGSSLRPVIENYGINQVSVTLYVDISIYQTMIIPFFEDNIYFDFSIPIALKIVNGEVPQFYMIK